MNDFSSIKKIITIIPMLLMVFSFSVSAQNEVAVNHIGAKFVRVGDVNGAVCATGLIDFESIRRLKIRLDAGPAKNYATNENKFLYTSATALYEISGGPSWSADVYVGLELNDLLSLSKNNTYNEVDPINLEVLVCSRELFNIGSSGVGVSFSLKFNPLSNFELSGGSLGTYLKFNSKK